MDIKAPIHSYESALRQIRAGAQELYVGLAPTADEQVCFSARGSKSAVGRKTNVPEDELLRIVKLAHSKKVQVELAANVPMLGNNPDGSSVMKEQYLAHVKRGIGCGVDRVIVGDFGNLLFLRKKGVTHPITGSTLLSVFNRGHLELLASLGVEKVVLPHHLSLEEIASLVTATTVKIEVFAHFGCSFIESTCALYHDLSETINLGLPCRARWQIEGCDEPVAITDVAEDCSICALGSLEAAGVSSIKIIGRELEPELIATVVQAYATALGLYRSGKEAGQVMGHIQKLIPWWGSAYCAPQRCKFLRPAHYCRRET